MKSIAGIDFTKNDAVGMAEQALLGSLPERLGEDSAFHCQDCANGHGSLRQPFTGDGERSAHQSQIVDATGYWLLAADVADPSYSESARASAALPSSTTPP